MESSLETQARAALADRLGGARQDVAAVVRYLDCCPLPTRAPIAHLLRAACDCLDEAVVRLGRDPPDPPDRPGGSAAFDEPVDDGE